MRYSRFVPANAAEALPATAEHVRAHLSSVADADDDPTAHADDVRILVKPAPGGWLVVGALDAEPNAPYLQPGFDPYDDVSEELRALAVDDEVTS
ncbi:hypothetical protein N8J89_08165 [Crossiella sp. CA-258035]|uniref:hypothetical protein n=1 Tax=Crossiella sp. CA-258035 TaxID=2981138 RepID=UPI0024BD45BC|nr:hypothetical protein [Crossiella sp. CA-258035]WHT21030.1 hypothetical protein N8J89_08165 [Crossiella sp. CA-258035]